MQLDHYLTTAAAVLPFLLAGFFETIVVSLIGGILGSILGALIGITRSRKIGVLTLLLGLYIHVLRGTPFLVQLYVFYFVIPHSGIKALQWSSFTAGCVALAFYTSSYIAEIVRAAINAVPSGQEEAAIACGMNLFVRLYKVILPQAFPLMLPPLSGVYVIIIKSTAVLSVVGITELTRQAEVSILRFPKDILFIYGLAAAIYFAYCFPVLKLADWLERRTTTMRTS